MNGQPNTTAADCDAPQAEARRPDRPAFRQIDLMAAVAAAFNVPIGDLCRPTRGRRHVARARQSGIYLARVVFGATLAKAGGAFGRDRTTAAHACQVVEKLRDNPRFDRLLTALEDALRQEMRQ